MSATADETTPLWPEGAVHNANHLGEHEDDEHEINYDLPRHRSFEHGPPADPWRISYWIMVIQGASMLLPWNVFITAQEFFKLRFRGSPFEHDFQNYFSVAFMSTNLIVVGSSILIQKQAPGTTHIIGSLLLNAAVFLSILVSIQTNYEIDSTTYFFFTLTMLSLSAISTSIVQNGMFGLASKFTGHHVQGVMLGQGVAGAGVAISQIVTHILSPSKGDSYLDDYIGPVSTSPSLVAEFGGGSGNRGRRQGLEHSAFLFFSFALLFTVISVLAQALLIRLPIYEYYTEEQPRRPIEFLAPPSPRFNSVTLAEGNHDDNNVAANGAGEQDATIIRRNSTSSAATAVTITPAMIEEANRRQTEEAVRRAEAERVNHYRSASLGATALANDANAMRLMQDIYPRKKAHPLVILYISITLVYGLTLSLFPSLTGLVESTNTAPDRSRLAKDLFVPLHFLTFNLGDWTGKALPSFALFAPSTQHPTRRQQLKYLLSSLTRFIFIPIFLTANLPIPSNTRLLPLLIQRDEVWFALVFLFALSNGYLGSIIMMVGPACVLGGENKARAGVKLGFWLTAGLALGSAASFGVRKLMCARGGCPT
ncbi:nucleoside transporter-domain-containing protein [Lobosporangium transversale]|uniref:Nucleoside transporter-domain-containing protein n=1 Tax=Lobosporangium transversale TaxID=64571 RepID=A0A1Y2GFV0_9FUNG|nr:nucleoside transporter-domain-containing protein [Lobosporangium transversale]ORZ07957.1 nucleoside transporter-domain-containing protein [Lobosporangium transversale]|eukprot:XP_021878191.1 nucleoside transporter-domain-containing protein [Lobosporangium transversale]